MEIRVSMEEAPRKCQFVESGLLDDIKFLQEVVSPRFCFSGYDGDCEDYELQDFYPVSSSFLYERIDATDDFKLLEDFWYESCSESYKSQPDDSTLLEDFWYESSSESYKNQPDDSKLLEDFGYQSCDESYKSQADDSDCSDSIQYIVDLGIQSSKGESIDFSTNFLLRDIWLNDGRPSSPIPLPTESGMNPFAQGEVLRFFDENIFSDTSSVQTWSPILKSSISNESCTFIQPAESKRHPVLEALARQNNYFSFFLREFDFYSKYAKCLEEEKCFACKKQRMSWANYPCCHLLWCDDCRNRLLEGVSTSEHKCIICDEKVEKMLHNLNSTSPGKANQPYGYEIKEDSKEFLTPALDDAFLKSSPPPSRRSIEDEAHDLVPLCSLSTMENYQQPASR